MDVGLPKYNEVKAGDRFSVLEVRHLDRERRELLNTFTYRDEVHGEIRVEKGAVTDFASVGLLKNIFLFVLYALVVGYGDRAATIHDSLYYHQRTHKGLGKRVSRKEADEIFYRALRDEGIARWRAGLFYLGVRLGGGRSWRRASR